MFILRPIREDELPRLVTLARSVSGSLTTLPPDRDFLQERLDDSVRAFRPRVRTPRGEYYLFVLEDGDTGGIVGTSGIAACVGGFDPFYSYEIRRERHASKTLAVAREFEVLHLKEVHRGPSEIGSLFLHPACRRSGAGRLLSLGRFLFMAAFPGRFDATVIAEMRGYIDQRGRSPFWEAVGRHFFRFDFYTADVLSGIGNKEFIADLMPRHPIYAKLLPAEVQAALGRVHHDAEPALAMLHAEGFAKTAEVDIFDAGPQLRATTTKIRAIRQAKHSVLRALLPDEPPGAPRLLANGLLGFRACLGAVSPRQGGVALSAQCAAALQLSKGDRVWHTPLR